MIKKMLNKMGYVKAKDVVQSPAPKPERPRELSTTNDYRQDSQERLAQLWDYQFKNSVHPSIALDSTDANKPRAAMDNNLSVKAPFMGSFLIPEAQMLWYAGQSFIGYQLSAMLAQNWLISKACLMPAKDATRNGYEITVNDGTEVDPEIIEEIKKLDVKYQLNKNLIQFVQMGRIFGIRIAMFVVETDDPDEYYKNPFNPDGVLPGSYKGITQIDPYWITPQLDMDAAGNPASIHFYEPTWWIINGRPVHRTHLVIFRTEEVADILKPTYIYGGVPIPQKIAERVYAAERTANEAPMLALTKRTDVVKADIAQATAQYPGFVARVNQWVYNRDNYGVKFLGLEEDMQQFDTSLADLDAVIMTQYQLVAAGANVPVTKLMGTVPKGFNSTGEYDESNYHEELESIQSHDLTPLIERHHLLLIRSEIAPAFGIEPFNTTVKWNELDALTNKELAEINRFKAETGERLIMSGAIDGLEERQRITTDPHSGYTGLEERLPEEMPGETELSDEEGA